MAKKSDTRVTLYNPGSTSVVYTLTGHVLGGDERITVDKLDVVGERAVKHGYLVLKESIGQSGSGESDQESTG